MITGTKSSLEPFSYCAPDVLVQTDRGFARRLAPPHRGGAWCGARVSDARRPSGNAHTAHLGCGGRASSRGRSAAVTRLGAESRSPQLHLHQLLHREYCRAGNSGRRHDRRRGTVRDSFLAARRAVAAESRA